MLKNMFKKSNPKSEIYAPVNGKIVPIEDVPDPVFSQKMMGEGIAIIPSEGKAYAPVDGEVIQIPDTKHAIGIRADDGSEILIHIGLETVSLDGQGFNVLVNTGDTVSVGQPLMEFDLDYIKNHASDIITPIVITNSKDTDKNYTMTDEKEGKIGETVIITASS
ncbi:PTS glucose transporter subunit IIA [Virgibacillus byunsanensis]|uniref:PTS glucose transporter subunit IIA n=1 Tax=Virgibacillus byunsanensis TaxID=570945 RepID=A0ABW3LPW0_9BACI